MPLIIDEVVISVEVANREAGGATPGATQAAPVEDRQALVEECVERVLAVLRERQEP